MDQFKDNEPEAIATLVPMGGLDRFGVNSEKSNEEQRKREKYKIKDFSAASDWLDGFYFQSNSIHFNKNFELCFCVPKGLFHRI